MKHLYGGMNFNELFDVVNKQTKSLVEVKRVFSNIAVGSLVRVHMLEITHEPPEGASLNIYHDYYKGVLDLFTPDMLKIIVRTEQENDPTTIRIDINQVIDAPAVLKSFSLDGEASPTNPANKPAWRLTAVGVGADFEDARNDYLQDIIEYLDEQERGKSFYIIEVI